MRYSGHIIFGATAGIVSQEFLHTVSYTHPESIPQYAMFYGALLLGSLIPDIDEPKSFIGRKTRGISDIAHVIFLGHRGITHNHLFFILLAAIFYYFGFLNTFLGMGFLIGYLSHLVADKISPRYIPLGLSPYFSLAVLLGVVFLRVV